MTSSCFFPGGSILPGHAAEIRMISTVAVVVAPDDPLAVHQDGTGHLPRVAHRPSDCVALPDGANGRDPHFPASHLRPAASLQAKQSEELPLGIGDRPGTWPTPPEESCAFLFRTHVKEEHRGVGRVGFVQLAQQGDRLPTEDSAEMSQENEQRPLAPELDTEVVAPQVISCDRHVPDATVDPFHAAPPPCREGIIVILP